MQKLQLSIPEPCHENWHSMAPTDQGRFCNACAKEVIDFSMMTDTEVLNYFTTITHEKVCGRALPSQLDRTITWPKEPKKRLFWYWNYIVMFFMFFSKANTMKAQGGVKRIIEISNAPACKVGETVKSSRVIRGKVTDINGNPVSFATIKIKDKGVGLSADANGEYAIRVNGTDVLLIYETGYKEAQVSLGTQKVINTVLERGANTDLGEIFVPRTYCIKRSSRSKAIDSVNSKYVINFQVKDEKRGTPIERAKIIVVQKSVDQFDTAFTDKNGMYVLTDVKGKEEYFIKVEAGGYGTNEFSFTAKDFKDKKKVWEISLKKIETLKSIESPIRVIEGISTITFAKGPIYVVDGTIVPDENKIDKADIEDITVLQTPKAIALFGAVGSNGAIVITTRKAKTKILDTVVVSSGYLNKGLVCRTGGLNIRTKVTKYADIKARIITRLTDSLEIYPNPVQKGTAFSVSLKLRQTGTYNIQVTDAAGRIVLQKQTNIQTKEYIEQVQADTRWSSGVYYIRVFDNNNKQISNSNFIVQ